MLLTLRIIFKKLIYILNIDKIYINILIVSLLSVLSLLSLFVEFKDSDQKGISALLAQLAGKVAVCSSNEQCQGSLVSF